MSIKTWSPFFTPYSEKEVRRVVPTSGGVYALWVKYNSGQWKCFYVGRAENLETRLLDHLSDNEPDKCIKNNVGYICGFQWIEVTTQDERKNVEKYLFDQMTTECNDNDPGGTPRKIDLPPTPPNTEPTT